MATAFSVPLPLLRLRVREGGLGCPSCSTIPTRRRRRAALSLVLVAARLSEGDSSSGFDRMERWIDENDELVRIAPVIIGGASFATVLLNRAFSRIPLIADASSAQSRADVLTLALAATIVLNGLVWISIKPKIPSPVKLEGIGYYWVESSLPDYAIKELKWAWEALQKVTCCRAVVIVYSSQCLLQVGLMAESPASIDGQAMAIDAAKLVKGSLCQAAWTAGKQNYLANLSLYPGRFELDFFPSNTQAVILQPLGDEGMLILAGDTVRGFGSADQAWISSIGEKLDSTLEKSSTSTTSVA